VQLLLVNAYILYKTTHLLTWKKKKKTLLSHYEFWSQIALEWLTGTKETTSNQTSESTKKCKVLDDSSLSTPSIKSRWVNDASLSPTSLSPTNEALRARLDSDYHYPVPPEADWPCCSVCHRSASSRDEIVRSNIFTCNICNASLCIDCFKPFHTIADVRKLRPEVIKRGKSKKKTGKNGIARQPMTQEGSWWKMVYKYKAGLLWCCRTY
jgi:hypothetical protein